MGTYTSTNARPCADCGLKKCPPGCGSLGLLTSIMPVSRVIVTPDFDTDQAYVYMEDGSLVTVPVVDVPQDPRDYVTMTGVLEAFDNQPQSHAKRRDMGGPIPVWPIACIFVGVILATFGLILNAPTSRFVWSLITGEPMP